MKTLIGTPLIGDDSTRLVDTLIPEVVPLVLDFRGDHVIGRAELVLDSGSLVAKCYIDDDEVAGCLAIPLVCTLSIDDDPIPVYIASDMSKSGQDESYLLGGRVTTATVLSAEMAAVAFQEPDEE